MGFATFRVGHASAHTHKKSSNKHKSTNPLPARLIARDDAPSSSFSPSPSCFTGSFYTAPPNGATLPALSPLPLTWDPSCLDTTHADIYLFSPGSTASRIHVWQRVPFAPGAYTLQLLPRWWNATERQSLQLAIVATDTPPFLTPLPAGPVFVATYEKPAEGSPVPPEADTAQFDSGVTVVTPTEAVANQQKSLASGRTAAAVLVPLFFIVLGIVAYMKWSRGRAKKETRRFSVAVDKRMSTISGEWKSMTPAGASAAVRSSMAAGRDSGAFPFGSVRPGSVIGSGVGVGGEMTQVRTGTGVGLRSPRPPGSINTADRVSRVSFAADTRISRVSFADTVGRPSGESRRTRAFHSAYVPPLPTRDESTANSNSNANGSNANGGWDEKRRTEVMSVASAYPDSLLPIEDGDHADDRARGDRVDPATLSPRQAQGPLTLTPDDIRARIQGQGVGVGRRSDESERSGASGSGYGEKGGNGEEMDAVMPALSMMRTGQADEYLFTPMPAPPTPTHPKPTSSHYTPASPAPTYTTLAPGSSTTPTPPTPTYGLMPTPNSPYATSPSPTSPFASSPGVYGAGLVSPLTPAAGGVFGQQQQQGMGQGMQGMMAPPAVAMSPDDMMKAYAERKAAAAAMGRSASAMSMGASSILTSSGSGSGSGLGTVLGPMAVAPSTLTQGQGHSPSQPPSAFTPKKLGGRKLSLRAGLAVVGVGKKDKERGGEGRKMMISAPMQQVDPASTPASTSTPAQAQAQAQMETPLYASYATGGQTASVYSSGPGMAGVGARSGAGGMAGVGVGVGVGLGMGAAYAIGEDEDEEGEGEGDYESAYIGTAN